MRGECLLPYHPFPRHCPSIHHLGRKSWKLPSFPVWKSTKAERKQHTHKSDVCRLETQVFPLPVERWETSRVGMEGASQEEEGEGGRGKRLCLHWPRFQFGRIKTRGHSQINVHIWSLAPPPTLSLSASLHSNNHRINSLMGPVHFQRTESVMWPKYTVAGKFMEQLALVSPGYLAFSWASPWSPLLHWQTAG